jgi:glycosyltransferase involved in cell wall biosynthesis
MLEGVTTLIKIDVMIPTRNENNIRPKLMKVLNNADWVKDIIIETSKPLSTARRTGALKCSTQWLAMFDDDVEIPQEWFNILMLYRRYINPNISAISSPSLNINVPHYLAYQRMANNIVHLIHLKTPFIDNTFIKRKVFEDYHPRPCFYAEDELLYKHLRKNRGWIHTHYIGVKHFAIMKDSYNAGVTEWKYNITTPFELLRHTFSRSIISILAVSKSKSLETIPFWWKRNIREIVGYVRTIYE